MPVAACFWGTDLNTVRLGNSMGKSIHILASFRGASTTPGDSRIRCATSSSDLERDTLQIPIKTLREINPGFSPTRTIDFGCGVGRLTLPLARDSASVPGVDVSPGMLSEAQKNSAERGVSNVRFALEVSGRFGLVHSFIVLQRIPPRRGLPIGRDPATPVEPGGWQCCRCRIMRII